MVPLLLVIVVIIILGAGIDLKPRGYIHLSLQRIEGVLNAKCCQKIRLVAKVQGRDQRRFDESEVKSALVGNAVLDFGTYVGTLGIVKKVTQTKCPVITAS